MKVKMTLAARAPYAEVALKRWRELGGSEEAVSASSNANSATFRLSDRDAEEAQLLRQLADQLGARPGGPVYLSLSAVYDEADVASAELLLLEIGGVENALDPATVESDKFCPRCGLPLKTRLIGKPRLKKKTISKLDLFTAERLAFAAGTLAEKLSEFKGAVLTEADAPAGAGTFFALEPETDLGYPLGDREAPCPECGTRRGTGEGEFVVGMDTFPRRAWDGNDVVGTAFPSNYLIVTQGPWKVLSDPQWRVAEGAVGARPVYLADDAEPIR